MPTILMMSQSDLRFGADLFEGVGGNEPITLRQWPDVGLADEIDFILIWGPPLKALTEFPNLKAVFSLGAGVDHLGDLMSLPESVPIIRFIDPRLTEEMTGYVLLNVLRFHRLDPLYRQQQQDKVWDYAYPKAAHDVRVGIAGAGVLGLDAAKTLKSLDYDVAVWSRTTKSLDGLKCYAGMDELEAFLARTSILVNILPLTDETRGLWNAERFDQLEDGAYIINSGRGNSLVEADLVAALDRGKLGGVALDVFQREPLPKEHAFWSHPKVVVTPHVASLTHPASIAHQVALNIAKLERGEAIEGLVDRRRGY